MSTKSMRSMTGRMLDEIRQAVNRRQRDGVRIEDITVVINHETQKLIGVFYDTGFLSWVSGRNKASDIVNAVFGVRIAINDEVPDLEYVIASPDRSYTYYGSTYAQTYAQYQSIMAQFQQMKQGSQTYRDFMVKAVAEHYRVPVGEVERMPEWRVEELFKNLEDNHVRLAKFP